MKVSAKTMQNVKHMKNLVDEKQREAFHDSELFHHTRLVLNQLTEEVPEHQTCSYFHAELTSH